MLGKILKYETYQLMWPFNGYWPVVQELHYELHPSEVGKEPKVLVSSDARWRRYFTIPPAPPATFELVELPGSDGPSRQVPLKKLVELERRIFDVFGNAIGYGRYGTEGMHVLDLILYQNGEVVGRGFAATRGDRLMQPEGLFFGDAEPAPIEPANFSGPNLCTGKDGEPTPGAIALEKALGMSVQEYHRARFPKKDLQGYIAEVKKLIGEVLGKMAFDRPFRGNLEDAVQVHQDPVDPTKFHFNISARDAFGEVYAEGRLTGSNPFFKTEEQDQRPDAEERRKILAEALKFPSASAGFAQVETVLSFPTKLLEQSDKQKGEE